MKSHRILIRYFLLLLVAACVTANNNNMKGQLSPKDKQNISITMLDCRSSEFQDDLNSLSMPVMNAWAFVILSPFLLLIQLLFIILSLQTPRLQAQPGDILIGAFIAEFILSIHWFLEALFSIISETGASSQSDFCIISSGLSTLGGYLWSIYNFLFFVFIGLSMKNSLRVTLISRKTLHLIVWISCLVYVAGVFIIGVNGKNLYGTCSVAFSEVSTPVTSIFIYFGFLGLSVVFFSRFKFSIPKTSFYQRHRASFHVFTRLYLIVYLALFGIITFTNTVLFLNCQYFHSNAADYAIAIGHVAKLFSSLFLPILRLFDPYFQSILQYPTTSLQRLFNNVLKVFFTKNLQKDQKCKREMDEITGIEEIQEIERSNSFGGQGQSTPQIGSMTKSTQIRLGALSRISTKFYKDHKNYLQKQSTLKQARAMQDERSFEESEVSNNSIYSEQNSVSHSIHKNLLQSKATLKEAIDFSSHFSSSYSSISFDQEDPKSLNQNIKKQQNIGVHIRPKKATQFLKSTEIPFLNDHTNTNSDSIEETNQKLFKLLQESPFLLEWNEYESEREAEDFCSRVEKLLNRARFQANFFNDPYYKLDSPKKSKLPKEIDRFFGISDDQALENPSEKQKSNNLQAETMLDSKDHFIMILQRNIKTAVLCRILSGIQLQFIRKTQYCMKLDISIDSFSNIFHKKMDNSVSSRPSRVLTFFPTLRNQHQSIFEEVKVLQFSDDSIKSIIKEAPKQLLDSDTFDLVQMKVYAPMVFHSLIRVLFQRTIFKNGREEPEDVLGFHDADETIVDIEKSFNLAENMMQIKNASGSDGGKSGQFFFFSNDNKFLLKTINIRELEIILNKLPKYFTYLKQHPKSLLARILGIYTFEGLSENPIHLILMQNIAGCTKNCILRTFDIKGSTYDRKVLPKSFTQNPKNSVENGSQETIQIFKEGSFSLHKLILKDLDFFILEQTIAISRENQVRVFESLQEDAEFLLDCGLIDYSLIVFKIDRRIFQRASTSVSAEEMEISESKTTLRTCEEFYRAQSIAEEGIYYHFGIIDYLQMYTSQKRLEKYAKKILRFDLKLDTSSQDPVKYSKRFIAAMKTIFEIS